MCWVAEDSRGGIVTERSYDDCNMAGFLSFMVDLSWCEFELRDGNCSVFKRVLRLHLGQLARLLRGVLCSNILFL